ncbi:MAG: hypothetical protein WAW20_10685, partial [Anaerolineae bacterium]
VLALRPGLGTALETWARLTANAQIILGAGALLAITVLAYLLQPLTFPLIRFYEGYWPGWMHRLSAWAIDNQRATLSRLKTAAPDTAGKTQALHGLHRAGAYYQRYLNFPRNEALLRPTQLGNTFTAAEEYPYQVYNLDAILWWPRLTPLLPDPPARPARPRVHATRGLAQPERSVDGSRPGRRSLPGFDRTQCLGFPARRDRLPARSTS